MSSCSRACWQPANHPSVVRYAAAAARGLRATLDRRAGTDSAEELVRAVLDEVRVPAEHTPRTR